MSTHRLLVIAFVVIAFVGPSSAGAVRAAIPQAPVAPVRTVTDAYFGTAVDDPYRWFEDGKSPEVQAWSKAQTDRSRRHPGRPLPTPSHVEFASADPRLDSVLATVTTWTADVEVLAYDPASRRYADTALQPGSRWGDPGDLVAEEVMVKSHDGVEVPLSIVRPKGARLDGNNPTILYGYGAYGFTNDPNYGPRFHAWYEQGGIYATCHVRGGGVFGEAWHLAGKMATKPNTWKDAIACGEYLVAHGYTRPGRMAINGGSAGGILVGRAMTERPDLFQVAVPQVGVLDAARADFSPNGVPKISEFGTVKVEEQFRGLLEMSAYAHVKDGAAYPATQLTHGINDPRVEPFNSMKVAARLQAASSSGRPVLLRLDYDAGHGIGSTNRQRELEIADVWSFMLWQFGVAGFQPE